MKPDIPIKNKTRSISNIGEILAFATFMDKKAFMDFHPPKIIVIYCFMIS